MVRRVLGLILLCVSTVAGYAAATDIGQTQWRLCPFTDTLDVSADHRAGTPIQYALVAVRWRVPDFYQILGTGVLTESVVPGAFDFTFVGAHHSAFFENNHLCSFHAVVDPATFSGPWHFECVGLNPPFEATGTLVLGTDCPESLDAQATAARPAGLR